MDSDSGRACPRCGAVMRQRLRELDCPRCGHFMPLPLPVRAAAEDTAAATAAAAPQAAPVKPRRGRPQFVPELLLDTPQPPPSRLKQPDEADGAAYDRRLNIEKALFCVVAAITLITGNLLVLRGQSRLSGGGAAVSMVIGGLIYAAFATLLLYIDWGQVKRYAIYFFLVTLFFAGYACFSFYTEGEKAVAYKLGADCLLLCWLISLLFRDCNRYE